jgi:hypothetical protein
VVAQLDAQQTPPKHWPEGHSSPPSQPPPAAAWGWHVLAPVQKLPLAQPVLSTQLLRQAPVPQAKGAQLTVVAWGQAPPAQLTGFVWTPPWQLGAAHWLAG